MAIIRFAFKTLNSIDFQHANICCNYVGWVMHPFEITADLVKVSTVTPVSLVKN